MLKKHIRVLFFIAFYSIFLCKTANAQTSYYLNPNTGQREVILLIITPLGTDAQYRNDYSVTEYEPISIDGDPMKLKKAKATLPTNEKITIIFPTNKEHAKFVYPDGQVKVFKDASIYTLKKDNQLAQIATQAYVQNGNVKYRVFYKPIDKKTEQELEVLEQEYKEQREYYKVIMPDGSFGILEGYTEEEPFSHKLVLTDTKGNKTIFTKEE